MNVTNEAMQRYRDYCNRTGDGQSPGGFDKCVGELKEQLEGKGRGDYIGISRFDDGGHAGMRRLCTGLLYLGFNDAQNETYLFILIEKIRSKNKPELRIGLYEKGESGEWPQ